MREAAQTLAAHAHRETRTAYANLANQMRGLSGISAADAAYEEAAKWASRFAFRHSTDWITLERAYLAYHAGRWDDARHLIAEITTTNEFNEAGARATRGRLSLGEARPTEAMEEAEAIIAYGISASSDDDHYLGTALEARSHSVLGNDRAALDACDRFLGRWCETGGFIGHSPELCEIAAILSQADRHDDIRRAARLLGEACRWRDALILTADSRYADAADLYTEIGSHPLAADTHLLAAEHATTEGRTSDAARHLTAVLDFAEKAGATLYRRQAERLTAASA